MRTQRHARYAGVVLEDDGLFRAGASFAKEREMKPARYVAAIRASGLTIYEAVEIGSRMWIPSPELESVLDAGLRGMDLAGLPLRTR